MKTDFLCFHAGKKWSKLLCWKNWSKLSLLAKLIQTFYAGNWSTLNIFPCLSSTWASSCFVIPSIVRGPDPWQGWACLGKSPNTSIIIIMKRFLMTTSGQSPWWMAFFSLVSRANGRTCVIFSGWEMYFAYNCNFKENLFEIMNNSFRAKILFLYLKSYIVATIISKLSSNHESGNTDFPFWRGPECWVHTWYQTGGHVLPLLPGLSISNARMCAASVITSYKEFSHQ